MEHLIEIYISPNGDHLWEVATAAPAGGDGSTESLGAARYFLSELEKMSGSGGQSGGGGGVGGASSKATTRRRCACSRKAWRVRGLPPAESVAAHQRSVTKLSRALFLRRTTTVDPL